MTTTVFNLMFRTLRTLFFADICYGRNYRYFARITSLVLVVWTLNCTVSHSERQHFFAEVTQTSFLCHLKKLAHFRRE